MDVLNCIITIQILYNLDLHDMFKYSLGNKVPGIRNFLYSHIFTSFCVIWDFCLKSFCLRITGSPVLNSNNEGECGLKDLLFSKFSR